MNRFADNSARPNPDPPTPRAEELRRKWETLPRGSVSGTAALLFFRALAALEEVERENRSQAGMLRDCYEAQRRTTENERLRGLVEHALVLIPAPANEDMTPNWCESRERWLAAAEDERIADEAALLAMVDEREGWVDPDEMSQCPKCGGLHPKSLRDPLPCGPCQQVSAPTPRADGELYMRIRCYRCGHFLAYYADHCPQCREAFTEEEGVPWTCKCERCCRMVEAFKRPR